MLGDKICNFGWLSALVGRPKVAPSKWILLRSTLDETEGRGLSWVLGKAESGIIEAKSPEGNMVSMETVRAKGEFSPEISNGKVKITIKISEEGNIGEQAGSENLSKLSNVAFLEEQKEKVIQSEVTAAINKAKKWMQIFLALVNRSKKNILKNGPIWKIIGMKYFRRPKLKSMLTQSCDLWAELLFQQCRRRSYLDL